MTKRVFSLDHFVSLAKKGQWEGIFSWIWEIWRRKIEADAPHKVYRIRADGPTLSGGGEMEETDEVIPLKDVLARWYGKLEEAVLDIERDYNAGRKILDQLPMRQEEKS